MEDKVKFVEDLMEYVNEHQLCVYPDKMTFDCMEEGINMARCHNCQKEYCWNNFQI